MTVQPFLAAGNKVIKIALSLPDGGAIFVSKIHNKGYYGAKHNYEGE